MQKCWGVVQVNQMIMGDSRDRLNLDDTAPGVVDRVRPPRLAKPVVELHPRKAVLRPIIPRSHHPRHFHYSLFLNRTGRIEKVGAG